MQSMLIETASSPRLLVAAASPLAREGMRAMLASTPDLLLVGEATSDDDAYTLINHCHPTIVLIHSALDGLPLLALTRRLGADYPEIKVLVLAEHADAHMCAALRAVGVAGCLLTTEPPARIIHAIRAIAQGLCAWSPQLIARESVEACTPERDQLTAREREVVQLLANGVQNEVIADTLHICKRTVRFHLTNIYAKLNLPSRSAVIVWAIRMGLNA